MDGLRMRMFDVTVVHMYILLLAALGLRDWTCSAFIPDTFMTLPAVGGFLALFQGSIT
jgi:hypothetical protein